MKKIDKFEGARKSEMMYRLSMDLVLRDKRIKSDMGVERNMAHLKNFMVYP